MPAASDLESVDPEQKWFWSVWTLLVTWLAWLEVVRLRDMLSNKLTVVHWLIFWDLESTLPLLLLLLLPVLMRFSRHRPRRQVAATSDHDQHSPWDVIRSACLVFSLSLTCSVQIGRQPVDVVTPWQRTQVAFADLPPAYHDEYSYLLQAETFLDGRLSYPPIAVRPDLFHQFHVLNEYRTVSRYFPWTGFWIAPFHQMEHAVWGHWLAGAFAATMFYLALRQIVRRRMALTGGLLIAVSPGLALFSNLLLAHQPTLLALSVFTWAFFRMQSTQMLRYAFVAGTGLTLAMLARPMTAAGFGLPFGLWLAVQIVTVPNARRLIAGFVIPLACGFTLLAIMNHDATGSWTRTAYQEYTDRYTPRHRYGFYNAAQNVQAEGPPAVQKYDQWATNLTLPLALRNVWERAKASLVWSLAMAPILLGLLMAAPVLLGWNGSLRHQVTRPVELRLLAAAVVTLHVVHIPYWFDGIMHWHYVLETAPLLLMLTGVGLVMTMDVLSRILGARQAFLSVLVFVGSGLIPCWIRLPVYDNVSKVSAAISELSFSRVKFEIFQRLLQHSVTQRPALVMVEETGTDPQLSYIINPPDLNADVLICRRPATMEEIQELRAAFADRSLYEFNPNTGQILEINDAATESAL
ncbi:MAG: hypothetical protein R3C59_31605 [Planctomycetaceae bacterium]